MSYYPGPPLACAEYYRMMMQWTVQTARFIKSVIVLRFNKLTNKDS